MRAAIRPVTVRTTPNESTSRSSLTGLSRLQALERRLDEGYARIEEGIARGEDVTAWESFWIDLLHQYEAECDALPEAA
ncbi:MAG TPA: hypothetical protein VD767_10755 [Thermomicrobiales bacterium]|nr:hypothetical protein [Thermomicrobiales bacterium]